MVCRFSTTYLLTKMQGRSRMQSSCEISFNQPIIKLTTDSSHTHNMVVLDARLPLEGKFRQKINA